MALQTVVLNRRFLALIRQRCPQCFEGAVFVGLFRMKERCAVCGHRFERQPGYFMGAMYVSYGLGIVALLSFTLVVGLVAPGLSPAGELAIGVPAFLLLTPALFRYSRIVWMHLNYRAF